MIINNIHKVYFIGAGGIGMSALAKYMLHLGKQVAGYDRTPTSITQTLSDLGMYIQFADDLKLIPEKFLDKNTLIVFTPAINENNNSLLKHYLDNDYKVIKRAELLAEISNNSISIAVAGTHGKTSTSSLLAHILKDNKISVTSFLGGIAENYNSNLILGGTTYTLVEADEFDRSFLYLKPDYACITSIDADHLDVYKNEKNLVNAFNEFAKLTKKKLFVKKGISIEGITYGINEKANYNASNIRIEKGQTVFDVQTPNETIKNVKINQPGEYNVQNTVVALAMANSMGISLPNIAKALLSYQGVQRRFSYRIQTPELVLIDDYAHHPTEINAVYEAVTKLYPNKEMLVIFQPHLYSRTRDFKKEFVKSLAQFHAVLLLPIYAAREKPINNITSKNLVEEIRKINANVDLVYPKDITKKITEINKSVVLMLGAGDIGEIVKEVQNKLKTK